MASKSRALRCASIATGALALLAAGSCAKAAPEPVDSGEVKAAASRLLEGVDFRGRLSFHLADPSAGELGTAEHLRALRTLKAGARRGVAGADHALAVVTFLRDGTAQALQRLDALGRATGDADVINDSAVALINRAVAGRSGTDLLQALEALDRAARRTGETEIIAFNRSLALSLLGLCRQAATAAGESRADPCSGSSGADQGPSLADWRRRKASIEARLFPSAAVDSAAALYPYYAVLWAQQELLPRWARAEADGPSELAALYLRTARAVGEVAASGAGDALLLYAVEAIETADAGSRAHLLAGLTAFGDGVVAYNRGAWAAAEELLRVAESELAVAASPLGHWASFYLGICLYFASPKEGDAYFEALEPRVDAGEFPILAGRIMWLRGTIASVHKRTQESVDRYHTADELLRSSAGPGAAAFMQMLLAEAYTNRGDWARAWVFRYEALQQVPRWEGDRRQIAMYTEAAAALLDEGKPVLALPFLREAHELARSWDQPLGYATVFVRRAQVRLQLGDREGAAADLRSTHAAMEGLPAGGVREIMDYYTALAEGQFLLSEVPDRAIKILEAADHYQDQKGFAAEKVALLATRAEAYKRNGQLALARRDLELIVDALESLRLTVTGASARAASLRHARPALEELIRLELAREREGVSRALEAAEWVRARWIADRWVGERLPRRSLAGLAARINSELRPGEIFVEITALPEVTLVWLLDGSSARLTRVRIGRVELRDRIGRLRAALQIQDESEARRRASQLHDLLWLPLGLDEASRLLVSVDPVIADLPLGVLLDRRSGLFLLEKAPIAVVPSAALWLAGRSAADRGVDRSPAALAVAVGEGFADDHALPLLPRARQEALAIRDLYETGEALLEEAATPGRVLREAPHHDVLHFALHSLSNRTVPELSALVLSPGDQEAPGRAGLLSIEALSRTDMSRTRLVTLAACSTAELVGATETEPVTIAGAFLAAGVRAVVATYWPIDDRRATRLMISFHRHYRRTLDASLSLREAILELNGPNARQPLGLTEWGAFVALGT